MENVKNSKKDKKHFRKMQKYSAPFSNRQWHEDYQFYFHYCWVLDLRKCQANLAMNFIMLVGRKIVLINIQLLHSLMLPPLLLKLLIYLDAVSSCKNLQTL